MPARPKKPVVPPLDNKGSSRSQTGFSLEDFKEELQSALEAGDNSRVLELLDSTPRSLKNQPEFLLFRAAAFFSLGHEQESMRLLLDLERKNPRFIAVYPPLAMLYMNRDCVAHALQAARRGLTDRDLEEEARDTLEQIIHEATDDLHLLATKLGVSTEIMQQGAMFHEKALMAMDENKFMEVDHFAQKAIKLLPEWNPPHNNRALALYFTGKSREAIDILESVLAREADNSFTLRSLVTFYYGLDQIEQARVYANRLAALVPHMPADGLEIEDVITALALVEDTPALWKIAKKYLKQPANTIYGRSWHCLAVAAARCEKWQVALDLMRKANEENELSPAGESFMDQLVSARRRRPSRLSWTPPEYPGADLYINSKAFLELKTVLHDPSGPSSPTQQRKLENHLQKYPYVKPILKRLLFGEGTYQLAVDILASLNQPDADAEILRFASGQAGDQGARVYAVTALVQAGRYTGPKAIQLWNEDVGEWREIILSTQRIGDISIKAQPKTLALIEKAHRARRPEESIALLRRAVENEPTCAIALFNLGVTLAQNGNAEEGEALIQKSVHVDPGYTYGHASIALSEADRGNERSALDHLELVTQADLIAPDTAVIANLAWTELALRKGDLKAARKHLNLVTELNPEHRLLADYEAELKEAEKYGFLLEYQRESAMRAHQKLARTPLTAEMRLRACLETNTRDMLSETARFLRTSPSGKKGELASWVAESLLDEELLQVTLEEDLEEKEREALRWVLEAGGVRPWSEFARKYGDDMYESTFWQFHKPQSIPGRLRMSGLFYSGTLDGQVVAFVPPDLRELLQKVLY